MYTNNIKPIKWKTTKIKTRTYQWALRRPLFSYLRIWDKERWLHNRKVRFGKGGSLVLGYCSGVHEENGPGRILNFLWVKHENNWFLIYR